VKKAHDKGMQVWGVLDNFQNDDLFVYTKFLNTLEGRQKVIKNLVEEAGSYNLDGINVDIEGLVEAADVYDFIEFVREISIACRRAGLYISINNYVPYNYNDHYDLEEQAAFADYVVIMGYDETTAGAAKPGPVASIGFVQEGIADTLAVVDKEKVINGLPLYTRVWSTSGDGSVSSFACGMDEAAGYLEKHGVAPQMREDVGLNYGSYTSDVDGNFYEIWLQDADAVTSEMELVRDYDLAGAAAWKIGFESSPQIWEIIRDHLQ
jgi:spore germination protein YaaH